MIEAKVQKANGMGVVIDNPQLNLSNNAETDGGDRSKYGLAWWKSSSH